MEDLVGHADLAHVVQQARLLDALGLGLPQADRPGEPAAEPAHAPEVLAGVAVAVLGGEAEALEHLELRLAQLERALGDLALQHRAP